MKKIILFDGECNLCDKSVNFILKHDINNFFVFASLQSKIGKEYLLKFNLSTTDFKSLVLIDAEQYYTASTAILRIAKDLSKPMAYLYFFIYVPQFVRDFFYFFIAKNRYSFFGKNDTCKTLDSKYEDRFLDKT